MISEGPVHHDSGEGPEEQRSACGKGPSTSRAGLSLLVNSPWKCPSSQTYPEVCFTNLIGTFLSSQVDIQD